LAPPGIRNPIAAAGLERVDESACETTKSNVRADIGGAQCGASGVAAERFAAAFGGWDDATRGDVVRLLDRFGSLDAASRAVVLDALAAVHAEAGA
jgi:hypothetical protein